MLKTNYLQYKFTFNNLVLLRNQNFSHAPPPSIREISREHLFRDSDHVLSYELYSLITFPV